MNRLAEAVLLAALAAVASARGEDAFPLARDGRLAAVIVPAENPCAAVAAAAEELQSHVQQATGCKLPIQTHWKGTPSPDRPVIFVGASPYTKSLGFDPATLRFEEFVIDAAPGRIVLMGRDDPATVPFTANPRDYCRGEAGTLLAVHTFLHDSLGVRWYYPGPLGTVVPKARDLAIPTMQRKLRPEFSPRETVISCGPGLEVSEDDWTKWVRRTRHGGASISMGHSFGSVVGEEYVKPHPEYFAVDKNGRRAFHSQGAKLVQLCLSQPELVSLFVRKAREHFDASPSHRSFTIMPGDSMAGHCCQCPQCTAQYDRSDDVPRTMRESRYVWGFVNKVAAQLKRDYPDRLIFCCAYGGYRVPHSEVRYEPNVAIGVTVNRVGFGYQLGEEMEAVNSWLGVVKHVYVDENYHYGAGETTKDGMDYKVWEGAPRLCPHRIAATIADRRGKILGEPYDVIVPRPAPGTLRTRPSYHMWMIDNLNLYVTAELNFDASQDVDLLIDRYCKDLYGPAAGRVKELFTLLERRWIEAPRELGIAGYKETNVKLRGKMFATCWGKIYSSEIVQHAFSLIAEANREAEAAADPVFIQRIRLLERGFQLMRDKSEQCANGSKKES